MVRMIARLCILASFLSVAFLNGCGGGSDGAKCVPGLTIECPCSTIGQSGVQTCTSAGTFAACACGAPVVDAGPRYSKDDGGAVVDIAVDQPAAAGFSDAFTGSPEAQPDTALIVPDAELDSPTDTALAVQDAQLDVQPEIPASAATLTADKSSVEFGLSDEGSDGGTVVDAGGAAARPIKLGSSGVATVVITNDGNVASGALAVVAGANVRTFGCTGALAPGATCSLTITATPTALGRFDSTVSIWATPGAVTPILITVSATVVPPPLITSFVASPTVVSSGGTATLTAVFSGGTGTVDQGIGNVTSGSETSTGPISTPTTYTLTVTNTFGDSTMAQVLVYPSATSIDAGGEPCVPAKTITAALAETPATLEPLAPSASGHRTLLPAGAVRISLVVPLKSTVSQRPAAQCPFLPRSTATTTSTQARAASTTRASTGTH
jgi:hypothetical protein